MMPRRIILTVVATASIFFMTACSTGPAAPEKGTPAFYWQAAKETFAAGNFLSCADDLDSLLNSQNEFSAKAMPWRLALESGLAASYMDLADSYEFGARANKSNPTPFRKMVSEYRTRANRYALQFAEAYQQFEKSNQDQAITLAFVFPPGSTNRSPLLLKAAQGILLTPDEDEMAHKSAVARGVVLSVCSFAGAPNDVAKTQDILRTGDAKVSRAAFSLAMAHALYDESQLYDSRKLDNPEHLKLFCTFAAEALKTVPESKETKDLNSKLQKVLGAKKKHA